MALICGMALLLMSARALADTCPPSPFTAKNGLSFKTYCQHDMPLGGDSGCQTQNGCDLQLVSGITSLQDCMEACSKNSLQRCYGVSFNAAQKQCYLKGILSDPSYLSTSNDWDSAIADFSQLSQPSDISCPSDKQLKAGSGMPFTVQCNTDFGTSGQYCSSNEGPCTYHANSLQECVEHCATSRPLCKGVSYNPDMQLGFPNCYLMKSPDTSNATTPTGYTVHSAKMSDDVLRQLDTSVPTSLNYTASGGTIFNLTQNDARSGANNFTSLHADSIGQCADNCASNKNQTCNGVLFDNIIDNGYSNCYLLSDTGSTKPGANMTFAQLTKNTVKPTESAQSISNAPPTSKAWIAGPVVAIVVVIVAIAAFFIWRRRRQDRIAQRSSSYGKYLMDSGEEPMESDGVSPFTPVGLKCACEVNVYAPQEMPGYITPKSRR
ncbi:hypothetical protein AMS68_003476 [Peltaster fructicola]|uniref:Apple domain-containing protein n=1 Tax=Peltaster fructicola TaxID=286661 RepID=A0A6H0XTL2_9PEZI|nr:hypothetical protein AMS68_003476 [Peltaster fructicola]